MDPKRILVVGSLNTDLVATIDRFPEAGETRTGTGFFTNCGGKGANQAYAAGALGGSVAMIGQVGEDDFGNAQIENLRARGVATKGILRDPDQPTGTALIGVESSGENRIVIIPGANGTLSPDSLDQNATLFEQSTLVLLQLEIPRDTVAHALQLATRAGAAVILDPAPASPLPPEWFSAMTYLTPNLSELGLLTNSSVDPDIPLESLASLAQTLCHQGAEKVIVKMGSRGALLVTPERVEATTAPSVEATDSTAAGDCFNAAFATHWLATGSEKAALEFAVHAASLSVTRTGAQAAMPSLEEVRSFQNQEASRG